MDRREILGNRVRVEISNANKYMHILSRAAVRCFQTKSTSGFRGSATALTRRDDYGDRRYGRSPDRGGRSSPRRYGR